MRIFVVGRTSFAAIEAKIAEFGEKAKAAQVAVDELSGGTFSISNGGVFGSLLSTPILNPPQSAILGMHKTQERLMVENGEIVIRPMLNLALSYDHRIIDGRAAVQFLLAIKKALEDPRRMLLGLEIDPRQVLIDMLRNRGQDPQTVRAEAGVRPGGLDRETQALEERGELLRQIRSHTSGKKLRTLH